MCRGGKDGSIRRCKENKTQHANSIVRKRVRYRAEKEGISVEDWKKSHVDEYQSIKIDAYSHTAPEGFQSVVETRRLPENIPVKIADHIAQNEKELSHLSPDERIAVAGYTGFAAGTANVILQAGTHEEYNYYEYAPPWRETNGPCDFATPEDLEDYLNTMDKVFSNRQEERRVLYRGTPIYTSLHDEIGASIGKKLDITNTAGLVKGLKEYYKEGKVFNYNSYLSTTSSAHYAADRTDNSVGTKETYWDKPEIRGLMFELKTNAGLDVTSASRNHAYEREVILPRETYFKVVGVQVRPETYSTVSGYDHPKDPDDLYEEDYKGLAAVIQMVEVDKDGKEITHIQPHKPEKPISELFKNKTATS